MHARLIWERNAPLLTTSNYSKQDGGNQLSTLRNLLYWDSPSLAPVLFYFKSHSCTFPALSLLVHFNSHHAIKMPKVTSSCELMDNAFPAGEVKLKGDFFVAQDEAGENMIFSVDDDGALQLILRNEMGDNVIVHLSSKFGVAAAEVVTALAVNQDMDGTIHLVFAARQIDGSSKLFVVEPMAPKRQDWNTTESLTGRLYLGEQWAINIREFLIVSVFMVIHNHHADTS